MGNFDIVSKQVDFDIRIQEIYNSGDVARPEESLGGRS